MKRRFLDTDTLGDFFYFWGSHLFSFWEKRCLALLLGLACWFIAHGFACIVSIACFASFFSFTLLLMNGFNVLSFFLSMGFGTGRQEKRCFPLFRT